MIFQAKIQAKILENFSIELCPWPGFAGPIAEAPAAPAAAVAEMFMKLQGESSPLQGDTAGFGPGLG